MTLRTPTVRDRILLHLLDLAKFAGAYDVPPEMTQDGIAKAAWIDVHHVVQYVRPLIAAGLARERSAHVRGGERKRKVYELTDTGRLKAYTLREAMKAETVLLREADGLRETIIDEVVKKGQGRFSVLDIVRQFIHAGSVDLTLPAAPEARGPVRFLADAPSVDEFVGRREELDALTGAGPAPRIFVVRGVAGIGKSSLAARACALLSGTHHACWHRVRSWDTPQSVLVTFAAFLAAVGKPSLRAALGEGRWETAVRILREDLAGLRAVLVLDDAHEARQDVLAFVRFLRDAVAYAPDLRLLVLTRRALGFYDRREVVLEGLVREIELGGLGAEDVQDFLGRVEPERIPDVGGHPLLLKLLRSAPEGVKPTEALRDARRFIQEAIYAELHEPTRKLMKLASLYRVPVPADALLLDPAISRSDLDALLDRSLIMVAGDATLEVHDAVREFFLEILAAGERKELGRFAAEHLFALARQAQEIGDLTSSVQCLSNALEVVPSERDARAIAEALGDVQGQVGDYQGGLVSFERALGGAEAPTDRARLRRKMASTRILRGELSEASRELETGFQLLGLGGDGERAWLYLTRSRVAVRLEEWEEALEASAASLDLFKATGDMSGQGEALSVMAHAEIHRPSGNVTNARQHLETALALAGMLQNPGFLSRVHNEFAYLYYRIGDAEGAQEHLAAVGSFLDPAEVSYRRADLLMLQGLIDLSIRADFARAEMDFHQVNALGEKLGSAATRTYARIMLAQLAMYQGRFAEARAGSEQLARDFEDLGRLPSVVDAISVAADCCLFERDLEGFRRIVRSLEEQRLARGTEARLVQTKTLGAILSFLEGHREEACSLLEEALAASAKSDPEDAWYPRFTYSIILQAMERREDAAIQREAAAAILRAHGRRAELSFLAQREHLLTEALATRG